MKHYDEAHRVSMPFNLAFKVNFQFEFRNDFFLSRMAKKKAVRRLKMPLRVFKKVGLFGLFGKLWKACWGCTSTRSWWLSSNHRELEPWKKTGAHLYPLIFWPFQWCSFSSPESAWGLLVHCPTTSSNSVKWQSGFFLENALRWSFRG